MEHDARFTLISLVPELHAGTGHVLGYHASVGEAARLAGWRHVALAPRDHGIEALPDGWRAVLRPGTLTAGLPAALRHGRPHRLVGDSKVFADSICEGVASVSNASVAEGALLIERFNGPQLLGVLRASRRLRAQRLHFWLMFRQDLRSAGFAGRIYGWVVRQLAREWGERFRLLADSESLAAELQDTLKLEAHVMPIPHTHASASEPFAKDARETVCWWPGAPRAEKGLASIQALAAAPAVPGIAPVRLVVSEETPLREGSAVRVERVPARLSEHDYDRWLATADVILLPYASDRYRHSTSGIFAEAVVGGRVPLVSAGTWMAYELEKHGLGELATEWGDAADVLRRIDAFARDPAVRAKLYAMRERFAAFHCEASYARAMRALVAGG